MRPGDGSSCLTGWVGLMIRGKTAGMLNHNNTHLKLACWLVDVCQSQGAGVQLYKQDAGRWFCLLDIYDKLEASACLSSSCFSGGEF